MTLSRYVDQTTYDLSGVQVPLPGVTIYVYSSDTAQLVTLTADGGAPLSNPFTSDGSGNYAFNVPQGLYDLRYLVGGKTVLWKYGVPVGGFSASFQAIAQNLINSTALTVTSATGQSVTTRGLLAGISSPVNGQTATLAETGREGVFKFDSSNLSASVTLDPNQGVYVPPSSATTGASGAWVRAEWLQRPSYVRSSWFGQKADGATDDTAAVQASWDFIYAKGGGTAELRAGVSIIGGALQDTSRSNAQLLLPRILAGSGSVSFCVRGPVPPNLQGGALSGAVLKSTITTGNGCVIGAKTTNGNGLSTATVYLEDFSLVMPQNPTNSGIDLFYMQANSKRNLLVTVDAPITFSGGIATINVTEPTTNTSFGIRGPKNDIPLWDNYEGVLVLGFYFGIEFGELFGGDNVCVSACKWPVAFLENRHAGSLGRLLILNSPNGIFVDGHADVRIRMLDIEHDTAAGSGPSWVEPHGVDIYDPNDFLRGEISWHMHDTAIPFNTTGCHNIILTNAALPATDGRVLRQIFIGFDAISNVNSVQELWPKDGNVPWHSNVIAQSSTTGTLGVESWTNTAAGSTDDRQVQVGAVLDGAINKGKYVISTASGGTLTDRLTVDSKGTPAFLTITTAADDAAAATAGVPSKGIYRRTSDGVLVARA